MSPIEVRRFRRADRDQLTALVDAHVAAVVPGASVSVNAVLSQLEREPGEFVVDPWVSDRVTLVAEQRQRVVAAAHLLRYADDAAVGATYRDAGEIRWFVCWPQAPFWPDAAAARAPLLASCIETFERWGVGRQYADSALPAPGVYGIPEQWPHVAEALATAGFVHQGRTELVLLADVAALPAPANAALAGAELRRSVGINGTRLSVVLDGGVAGFIEVETLGEHARSARHAGFADVGNLHVAEAHRRRGVGRFLLAQARDWLELARADRLLAYAADDEPDWAAFLRANGFRVLTRTQRGWERV